MEDLFGIFFTSSSPPCPKTIIFSAVQMGIVHKRSTWLNRKRIHFTIGTMIAMSLVHRGLGPHFFKPAVADYIIYGMSKVKATPSDVPDKEIQQRLIQV